MKHYDNNAVLTRFISITAILYYAGGAFSPYITAYYRLIGFDNTQIGIISFAAPLSAMLFRILAGYVSDRTKKRKRVLQVISMLASLTSLLFLSDTSFQKVLVFAVVFTSFSETIIPLTDAILSKRANDEKVSYAKIRLAGTISYAVSAYVSSLFIANNTSIMFPLTCAYYAFDFIAISNTPQDVFNKSASAEEEKKSGAHVRFFDTHRTYGLLLMVTLSTIGMSMSGVFIGPRIIEMGFDQKMIGLMSVIDCISEIAALACIESVVSRIGLFNALVVSMLSVCLRMFMYASNDMRIILTASLLNGPGYVAMYYISMVYLARHTYEEHLSSANAVLGFFQNGVGAFIGGFVAGKLSDEITISKCLSLGGKALLTATIIAFLCGKYIIRKSA